MKKILKFLSNPSQIFGLIGSGALLFAAFWAYGWLNSKEDPITAVSSQAGQVYQKVVKNFSKEEKDKLKDDIKTSIKADLTGLGEVDQKKLSSKLEKKLKELQANHKNEIKELKTSMMADIAKSQKKNEEFSDEDAATANETNEQIASLRRYLFATISGTIIAVCGLICAILIKK